MPYVRGSYPTVGGIAWHNADRIYGIGHVHGSHWVVYKVCIKEQCIVIYDSLSECGSKELVLEEFILVSRAIPALCKKGEVWRRKGWDVDLMKSMRDVIYFPHSPQETNDYDCGVMCIKYIECLVAGNPVSLIDPHRCGVFRQIVCVNCWHVY